MKNLLLTTLIVLLSCVSPRLETIEFQSSEIATQNYQTYVDHIAYRESRCNYQAKNSYGFYGKYQFGKLALKDAIETDTSWTSFLDSPKLQEYAMYQRLCKNEKRLAKIIEEYDGKKVGGIIITKSGLLAGSHIGGIGGVKRFIKSGGKKDPSDAFGTRISDYIAIFSHFDLELNKVSISSLN